MVLNNLYIIYYHFSSNLYPQNKLLMIEAHFIFWGFIIVGFSECAAMNCSIRLVPHPPPVLSAPPVRCSGCLLDWDLWTTQKPESKAIKHSYKTYKYCIIYYVKHFWNYKVFLIPIIFIYNWVSGSHVCYSPSMFYFTIFSSPELKAQVSFSDRFLSVVRLSSVCRLSVVCL
jgi:hypothetical protein